MIIKFELFNEGIKSLLVGPTENEIWSELMNGKLKGFLKSIPKSPEDFFIQMKEDCKILNIDDNYFWWGKNHTVIFWVDKNKKYLYLSDNYIWLVLSKIYNLNWVEIRTLISEQLSDDINFNILIPIRGW